MTRSRTAVVAAGLVLAALAPVLAQDKDRAFKEGLDARDRRDWGVVANRMQQAIRSNPTESSDKVGSRLGFGGTEYLPYFFLGEAFYQQGNCVDSLDAWNHSEQQGRVQKIREHFTFMQTGYAACEKNGWLRVPKFEAAAAGTRAAIDAATALHTEVSTLAAAADLDADQRSRYERAKSDLQRAQLKLDEGARTHLARDLREAVDAATSARDVLAGLKPTIEALIAAGAAVRSALSEVGRAIERADALDREIESKKLPLTDALVNTRDAGQQALRLARGKFAEASRGSTGAIGDARNQAQVASTQFQRVLDGLAQLAAAEIERSLRQLLRAAREKFTLVNNALAEFDHRAAARPENDPKPIADRQVIETRLRAARRRLDAATRTGDAAGIEAARTSAEELGAQLDNLILAFGPRTIVDRGVHVALADGAQLFLDGRFDQALSVLNPKDGFPPDMPFLEHVYVFRAAALHHLYLRSSAGDPALLEAARADIARLKLLNSMFQPDSRAFSPTFIEFFRHVSPPTMPGPATSTTPIAHP